MHFKPKKGVCQTQNRGFFMAQYIFNAAHFGGCENPNKGLAFAIMKTPIYEFVLAHLEQVKGTWPDLAAATGISRRTIEKIARREISNPGIAHIQTLADHFGYGCNKKRKAA